MKCSLKLSSSIVQLGFVAVILSLQSIVQCESNCDDSSKLQYEAGKAYVYNLEQVTYHSYLPFKGKITMKGKVVLTALENCEYVLTLENMHTEVRGDRWNSGVSGGRPVPNTSVKFAFRNGEVSNLRREEGRSTPWTENIVRGILTMLQNKALGFVDELPEEKEINFKGECLARVYIPSEGTYTKFIAGSKCSNGYFTDHTGIPYENPSSNPSHQHRRSNHFSHLRCAQTVKDGLVSMINCTSMEDLPFKLRAETETHLELQESAKEPTEVGGATSDQAILLTTPMSIVYDVSLNTPNWDWEHGASLDIVRLTKSMFMDKDVNKADLYLDLKRKVEMIIDFEALEEKLKDTGDGNTPLTQFSLNMLRDAASEAGSESAIAYITNLILRGELSDHSETFFLTHLHHHKNASLVGVQSLHMLVNEVLGNFQNESIFSALKFDGKKRIRHLVLGVSAYLHNFCIKDSECGSYPEYQELVSQIAQFCLSKDIRITPAAFQALGNVEHLSPTAVNVVKEVLTGSVFIGKSLLEYKKLAALDAFRRDPCQPELKKLARDIFVNPEMSSEMRMTAYLALSRCLEEEDLKVIDTVFESEPQSLVSSFVASHVYNIMDSQSPSKNYMKESLLSQIGVPETVPTVHNLSDTSKFLEYSTFHSEEDRGFSLDGYMFFEETGRKAPIFAMVNVTADVHGRSYNTLQIGLSWRYIPDIQKYSFLKTFIPQWVPEWAPEILPAFMGPDSFFRVDGTTIAMTCDGEDLIRHPVLFDEAENDETHVVSIDVVKTITIFSKQVTVPTLSGLPFTITGEIAFLPLISAQHTGDPNGLGLWDVFTKWDDESGIFRHNSSSDRSLIAKLDIELGKGTPVHLRQRAVAKIHCNHSIGFESIKNVDNTWIKKIDFPDQVIFSKRVTLERDFSVDFSGRQMQRWSMFGEPMEPIEKFSVEGMGIRISGTTLNDDGAFDFIVKAEKAEESFSGYSMEITSSAPNDFTKVFDVKFKADGLSSNDVLEVKVDYADKEEEHLEGPNDKPKFSFGVTTTVSRNGQSPFGIKWEYSSEDDEPKTQTQINNQYIPNTSILSEISSGVLSRSAYQVKLNCIRCTPEKEENMLFESTLRNSKENVSISMSFDGPLKDSFGMVEGHLSLPQQEISSDPETSTVRPNVTIFSASLFQQSSVLGNNRLSSELIDMNNDIVFTAYTETDGVNHQLSALISPMTIYEETNDAQEVFSGDREKYEVIYKNSEGVEYSLKLGTNSSFQSLPNDTDKQNEHVYAWLTSTEMAPIGFHMKNLVESRSPEEYYSSYDIIADANGLRVLGAKMETQYMHKLIKEGPDDDHCITGFIYYDFEENIYERENSDENIPMKRYCLTKTTTTHLNLMDSSFEMNTKYSDVGPNDIKFNLDALHKPTKMSGDLSTQLDFSPQTNYMSINKQIQLKLDNIPERGVNSDTVVIITVDVENRTLDVSSRTIVQRGGKSETWRTNTHGTWPENIWDGVSTLNIKHTTPREFITLVDITNTATTVLQGQESSEESGIFKNNLTTLISHSSSSRMALPPTKKFIWLLTSDESITDEQKTTLDYIYQIDSDIKLEVLGEQEEEILHLRDHLQLDKTKDVENWVLNGACGISWYGKERVGARYEGRVDAISKWNNRAQIEDMSETTELASASGEDLMSTIEYFYYLDAWYEQEEPSLQNHTLQYAVQTELTAKEMESRIFQITKLILKTKDIAFGNEVSSIEAENKVELVFKDLTHFSRIVSMNLDVDNKTSSLQDKIVLDGPYLSVYSNRDDENPWLVDFAVGLYEEKHQHKFNFRSKTHSSSQEEFHNHQYLGEEDRPHHHHHHHHHHHDWFPLPHTNFNVTISR